MLCVFTGRMLKGLKNKQSVLLKAGVSANTRITRRCQLNKYEEFCIKVNAKPFPCSSMQCRLYATYLSKTFKPVSVRNYVSAVWYQSKLLGYAEFSNCFLVKQLLNDIERTFASYDNYGRYPLSPLELLAIYKLLDMNILEDRIFWAASIICFRGLLRKSHVTTSAHFLECRDVTIFPNHLVFNIRSSKTDQFGRSPYKVYLQNIPDSPFCISGILKGILDTSSSKEVLFRFVLGNKWVPFTYSYMNARLKGLSCSVGLPFDRVSTHSLRHGGSSMLKALGVSVDSIMSRGNWKSKAVYTYLHQSEHSMLVLEHVPVSHMKVLI